MKTLQVAIIVGMSFAGAARADWPPEDLWYKCKGCHGLDGKAKTKVGAQEKMPDMTTEKWQAEFTDAAIKDIITNGYQKNPKMKAYKDKFTQSEIDSLTPYIRQFKGK